MEDYRPIVCESLSDVDRCLETDGYAVVKIEIDSLDPDELKQTLVKDFCKLLDRTYEPKDVMKLEPNKDYPWCGSLHGLYGMCQSDFCWKVRTNKEIQDVFRHILDAKELVCSMDAFSFTTENDKVNDKLWLHRDYNKQLKCKYDSYQGIYYLTETKGNDATTAIIPGSHKWDMTEQEQRTNNHFVTLGQPATGIRRLLMKPGELLIFNSLLVHQGCFGPNRLCVMVSYGKKSDRAEDVRRQKVLQYITGQRTTHWSQLGQAHGNKYPKYNFTYPVTLNQDALDQNSDIYKEDILELVQDNYIDLIEHEIYASDLDQLIPEERLILL